MIVLRYTLLEEIAIELTNVKCHAYNLVCKRRLSLQSVIWLHFSMQEELNLVHTIVECHVFTLYNQLVNNCAFHNIVEHTNAKILVNTPTPSVMRLQ